MKRINKKESWGDIFWYGIAGLALTFLAIGIISGYFIGRFFNWLFS